MRISTGLLCALACAAALPACGDDGVNQLPDAPGLPTVRVSPPDATVTIVNGAPVTQAYTATLLDPSGVERDVTAEVTWSLREPRYGDFQAAALQITGQGAGPTRVIANFNGVSGDTGLTVFVKQTLVDADVDPTTPERFEGATEDAALAPSIVYPLDRILVPPNLGQFDVHWTQGTADVFEIQLSNQYVDIKRYTNGDDPTQRFWTLFASSQWYPIASSREQLTLRVAGMVAGDPTRKGTAASQHVDVTNEDAQGGIYYWTTSGLAGIWRYDVGTPDVPPSPYFPDNARPSSCMGCHSLSRDGTKIAMTIDSANGRGAVFNVADRAPVIPYDGTTQPPLYWNFAAFNADATRLITIENSQMRLRGLDGAQLGDVLPPVVAGRRATHPEVSPDNTLLANVEFSSGEDYTMSGGSIVVRSYDAATDTFGAPTVLVAVDPLTGVGNFYPSFSPDGKWLAFTRGNYSYDDSAAQTWIVKVDGSQPPIQLATANVGEQLTNSWPRWVPFAQTHGATGESLFYLTFSSKRQFGVRIPFVGRPQIWMTPFFPDRATAGLDPSGPTFRVPFQDVTTSNHIAQWTQAVVIQ